MITAHEPAGASSRYGLRVTPGLVRDLVLAGLALSSGAVDAISYLALGKVFTAFQTGNLVFLALGLTGTGGPGVWRPLLSLAAFATGIALGARIVRRPTGSPLPLRRVVTTLSLAAGAEAVFLAAWVASSGLPDVGLTALLIGVLALAMGLQSAAVLSLGLPGIFTTAATATIVDLVSDLAGMQQAPLERTRLVGVLVGLLVGAGIGAVLLTHVRVIAPLFPLGAILLVIIASSWLQRQQSAAAHPSAAS